ncbi:zinc finger X-linked protein ZXDA-like isoform X1 [Centruroides sculpturatus]|uniref:zinc finger X-linked protein ZXDA-like isoform X1 n=2 Tax=Centruroides sculpturatus TaxID=218467 RepID=UPI000C6E8E86|nr:zinc finger X-linked protein ZXDA-like isoform X1 [Centruroides sculpturatus]
MPSSLSCKKKQQIIREDSSRPFKCPIEGCEWAFGKEYRLKRHLESHEGKKNFICDHEGCNRQFTTIYNLNAHKKLHKRPDSILCPAKDCGQLFPTRRKMEQHLSVHKEVQAPYKCPFPHCGKEYYSANSVASHIRVHKYNEDDFKCPYEGCRKVFDKICRLKQHVRYHTGERPYVCDYEGCGWTFVNASKLTRHMQKHTGERKYACSEPGCGKSFMRLEHLKGHMIIHTGDKPFVCPHENCNARFAAKSSLYVHMKKHSGSVEKLIYPCPIASCDKKYNCKASLRLHMLKVHSSVLEGGQQDTVTLLSSKELQEITSMDGLTQELTNTVSLVNAVSLPNTSATLPETTLVSTSNVILSEPLTQLLGGSITPDLLSQQLGNNIAATQFIIPDFVVPNSSTVGSTNVSTTQTLGTILNPNLGITVSSNELELLASSRILQENNSGSARTDYCSNHIISSRAKKWWLLQQQLKNNLTSTPTTSTTTDNLSLSDGIKQSPNSNQILRDSSSNVSADVMLASTPFTYRDSISGTHFIQTYILPDDPPQPTTNIYQDDQILTPVTTSSLITELSVPISLLSDPSVGDESLNGASASDFGTTSTGDTEFTGSTINLQDLE